MFLHVLLIYFTHNILSAVFSWCHPCLFFILLIMCIFTPLKMYILHLTVFSLHTPHVHSSFFIPCSFLNLLIISTKFAPRSTLYSHHGYNYFHFRYYHSYPSPFSFSFQGRLGLLTPHFDDRFWHDFDIYGFTR